MKSLDGVTADIEKILKDNNAKTGYEMVFPQYNVLPDEVKLAISVLNKHGMIIRFVLKQGTPDK